MQFKKLIASLLIGVMLVPILPTDIFALSTGVVGAENYPGKMNIKNVNGLGKNLSNDYFGGAMNFSYPFAFPAGSRAMTPSIGLSYSSNNSDAFSPYGYGFSLSIPRIQRNTKKGVSELYVGNEFSAFGNDLIAESGSTSRYRAKDANDVNIYTKTSSGWVVQMSDGKKLSFGINPLARIADTQNNEKIYAWMLESEEDLFGHKIQYEYFQSGGQPLISRILYGFDTSGQNPLYEIRFSYIDKGASLSSHKTQFEIKTTKLLSDISLFVSGNKIRSYVFSYDAPDAPVSHLVSIGESSSNLILPKTDFMYGEGQFRHMITGVNNNRGGIARFEYTPSTGYRTGSGDVINSKLPFMVMTLSRQTLEDSITGIKTTEQYEYSSGSYYYDSSDIWGREYVGFGRVTISDEKRKKILSFHQSQRSEKDILKFEDHIAKKGLLYRTQIFDKSTDKLLQDEIIQYDMRTLFGERRLVLPRQKLQVEYGENGQKSAKTDTYLYDNVGNLLEETRHGFVNANIADGTWIEIPGDETKIVRTYTENPVQGISKLPVSQKVYGFSGELLSASHIEYDGLSTGATYGLVTTKILEGDGGVSSQKETFSYSPTGMNREKRDALGNTTSTSYDSRDIAITSTRNPLGWETRYLYNYSVGKPEQVTNQNAVITRTTYDPWGREKETYLNSTGTDILISEKSYDDSTLPNNISSISYLDTSRLERKIQKSWLDGWGRAISTLSSMKDDGQYTIAHIRYDTDGNPLYASYPYFVTSSDWQKDILPYGVVDGEEYRAKLAGVSYAYDALGRITREKTSRGTTEKVYTPNMETFINALGYKTTNSYDAYGNLVQVREHDGVQDIITRYTYDALGRTILITDALSNIRTWEYDALGRMKRSTDAHAPSDITYGVRQYSYDAIGRVDTYENANGEMISYTYDPLGRPLTETLGDLGMRTYVYDIGTHSLGTLSSVTDRDTTVSFTYDPLGRKIGEIRTLGDKTYSLSYEYNLSNALTSIMYPDGGQATYGYKNGFADTVQYTDTLGVKNSLITSITYSPNSTMNTMIYGNGVIKTIDRDVDYNYRLTRVCSTLSGTTLLDTSYDYDAIPNITRIQEGGIEPLRKTIDYTYDPIGRLTRANTQYALSGYGRDTTKNLSYTYDPLGNILSASSVGSYTYSGEGYTSPHAVTTAGDVSYAYDRAGNTTLRITPDAAYSFSYSPYGEMLSSTKNGEKTTYAYDYTKRRVIKSNLGLLEHHVIDGYEVEYESGALVPVNSEQITVNNIGTTDSGSLLTNSGATASDSTLTNSGVINGSGTTSGSGGILTDTGTLASSGYVLTDSGTTLTDSGSTNSGSTDTGRLITDSGSITQIGSTETGSTSGSGETLTLSESGAYMVIASYAASTLSGAIPITLTTTLTHIMLGDERIATFQTQSDDSPKTLDDDKLIFHLSDHLNSSSLDLSSTGVLLQAVDYLPFGKSNTYEITSKRIKGKKGGYTNKYLFANKQLDEESDLQYFEKRYYDNRIGRFTTEDPVFWEVGRTSRPGQYYTDPQQWNSYSYVRNNPINFVDPTGELLTGDVSNPIIDIAEGAAFIAGTVIRGYYLAVNFAITEGPYLASTVAYLASSNQPIVDAVSTSGNPPPSGNNNGGQKNNGDKGGKGGSKVDSPSMKSQIDKAVDTMIRKDHTDARGRFTGDGIFNSKDQLSQFAKDTANKYISQVKNGMNDIQIRTNNQMITVRVNINNGSIQSINAFPGASTRTGVNVIKTTK